MAKITINDLVNSPENKAVIPSAGQSNFNLDWIKQINEVVQNIRGMLNDVKTFMPNTAMNKQNNDKIEHRPADMFPGKDKAPPFRTHDYPTPQVDLTPYVKKVELFQFLELFLSQCEQLELGDLTLEQTLHKVPFTITQLHQMYKGWLQKNVS